MLEDAGYHVSVARDGAAMRAALESGKTESGKTVDAVLLDALLPDASGTSLAHYAKERRIAVVACPGTAAATDVAHRERFVTLKKPFVRRQLQDAVAEALASVCRQP